MKHLIAIFTIAISCVMPSIAAELSDTISVERVFLDTDSKALEILQRSTRMDMLDYAKAGQNYAAVNEFYGHSSITSITDSCIDLNLTQVTTAQIFTLPTANGGLAALIYTITAGAKDSQIEFFDGNLKPVKLSNYFKAPQLKDFVRADYRKNKEVMKRLNVIIPFISVAYEYHPERCDLTATLALKEIATEEDIREATPYLELSRTYSWTGQKWQLNNL